MGEPATGRVTIAEISRERCSGTTPTKPRPGPSSHQASRALLGQLARVGKDDLRPAVVIADLPGHADALAAQ